LGQVDVLAQGDPLRFHRPLGRPDALVWFYRQRATAENLLVRGLYKAAPAIEGRIIAGDAFSHKITKGLGLPINDEELDYDDFPDDGERGAFEGEGLSLLEKDQRH
jgi:hypothetical protein